MSAKSSRDASRREFLASAASFALEPVQTVSAGVPFGRPYNSPFAVR